MEFLKNEYVRYVLILLVGITIGVIFYPSKRMEEKLSLKYEQEITSLKEIHSKETSDLNEKFIQTNNEVKSYKMEQELKVTKLTSEIKSLQSKQKTSYFKIVRPDGTVEIKKFTENEINQSSQVITQVQEEFKQKVESIEQKWSSIHKERVLKIENEFNSKESEYKKTIEELQKSKITTTNQKRFGLETGIFTNKDYYGHISMDVWGPMYIGIIAEHGINNLLGVGTGIRF
jgi:hypothetical protein